MVSIDVLESVFFILEMAVYVSSIILVYSIFYYFTADKPAKQSDKLCQPIEEENYGQYLNKLSADCVTRNIDAKYGK